MRSRHVLGRAVLAVVVALAGRPALAQTTQQAKPPTTSQGQTGKHTGAGHGPQAAGNLPVGARTTGAWLDDASVLDPGSSWLALSWDDWKSPSGSGRFFPTSNLAIGLSNRVQIQALVPYQYGGASPAFSSAGIGDVYAGAKIVLTDPSEAFGVAVTPTAEILSAQVAGDTTGRLHWVLPVSAAFGGDRARVYASAGYFSRGAVFVGGGISGQVSPRLSLVASLTRSNPVGTQILADGTPAGAQTDLGGGAYVTLTDRVAVFGNVGRTISQLQTDSTSRLVSVGVAIAVRKGHGIRRQK